MFVVYKFVVYKARDFPKGKPRVLCGIPQGNSQGKSAWQPPISRGKNTLPRRGGAGTHICACAEFASIRLGRGEYRYHLDWTVIVLDYRNNSSLINNY